MFDPYQSIVDTYQSTCWKEISNLILEVLVKFLRAHSDYISNHDTHLTKILKL